MKMVLTCLTAICLTACTTSTSYGPCIGITEQQDAKLIYKPDIWNIVVGVVFSETIVVPVIVAVYEFQCPVATK